MAWYCDGCSEKLPEGYKGLICPKCLKPDSEYNTLKRGSEGLGGMCPYCDGWLDCELSDDSDSDSVIYDEFCSHCGRSFKTYYSATNWEEVRK